MDAFDSLVLFAPGVDVVVVNVQAIGADDTVFFGVPLSNLPRKPNQFSPLFARTSGSVFRDVKAWSQLATQGGNSRFPARRALSKPANQFGPTQDVLLVIVILKGN